MPSDEYAPAARGPLRLKGAAGVTKKKKKKSGKSGSKGTDLEKNLSTGGDAAVDDSSARALVLAGGEKGGEGSDGGEEGRERTREDGGEGEGEGGEEENKTETERRFAEAKKKRLKELTESGRIRPELLKTHKERVEELNAHLARLSEHHDMPKIGPG
ncbi:uncharacterized protein B0H64DRAFT_473157 [Chaetomium fimeti]|uniref:DUF1754-domain-containing protein n=1 Tax=Chaetomium fimeti TaxID=1854472 RepID=A0AAE0HJY1_9PEZI|nr:hypothetical protein B0H64DRAFT_473157 [Chaetomium fimeti]